jgi:hypothetical protein
MVVVAIFVSTLMVNMSALVVLVINYTPTEKLA